MPSVSAVRISELEGVISELQITHEEAEKRFEGTVSQQTKLIDFLQAKSEAPPRKKVGGSREGVKWMTSDILESGGISRLGCGILSISEALHLTELDS